MQIPFDQAKKYPLCTVTEFATEKNVTLPALQYSMKHDKVDYTVLGGKEKQSRMIVKTPKTLNYIPNGGVSKAGLGARASRM